MEYYQDIDYSILPPDIERAMEREDIPYLGRFMLAMSCYEEFIATYDQKTPRSIHMRDQFDLVAYMMRNSKLTIDQQDPPLVFALDYIDAHGVSDGISTSQLVSRCVLEKEKIYEDHLLIHIHLWSEHREILERIRRFMADHQQHLITPTPFITDSCEYEMVCVKDLFEALPIQDQLEIATGEWKGVDLLRRSAYYLLVVKLLYEITIDKELATRHPYLIARREDILEITTIIMQKSDGNEQEMRMLSNVFAEVSGLDTGEVVSKCLLFRKGTRRGERFLDD